MIRRFVQLGQIRPDVTGIRTADPPEAFAPPGDEPDLFSSLEERGAYHPRVSARILVDGLPLRGFPYPHTALVKGDARSLCIAMASIVAKVARDRRMTELDAVQIGRAHV